METPSALTQLVLNSWDLQLTRLNQLLHALSDDRLLLPMAPGRSRGIYILGHLIAVHDRMIPTLYLGEQMYGSWHDTFLKNPDDPTVAMPSVQELRAYWSSVNQFLEEKFRILSPAEWLQKHSAVSEEDFAKEPHRNKLNLLLNRTNHLSYHHGQLVFLKEKLEL